MKLENLDFALRLARYDGQGLAKKHDDPGS
jgi:hypothetical protein